jgi:hypothetical protein
MAEVPGCARAPSLSLRALRSIASLQGQNLLIAAVATASMCSLRGQGVVVVAFANAGSQTSAMTQLRSFDGYFSDGVGWASIPTTTSVALSGLSAARGRRKPGRLHRNRRPHQGRRPVIRQSTLSDRREDTAAAHVRTRPRPRQWRELLIAVAVYGVYDAIRGVIVGSTGRAERDGRELLHFEQVWHLDPEHWLNTELQHAAWLAVPACYF